MTTIPLLAHEQSAAGTLRALWRPVVPQPQWLLPASRIEWQHDLLSDYWQAVDRIQLTTPREILWEGRCPYGKPGAVARLVWTIQDQMSRLKIPFHREVCLSTIAVKRVADMTEQDAVDWGLYRVEVKTIDSPAKEWAAEVWCENYGAAEWAWVMGVKNTRPQNNADSRAVRFGSLLATDGGEHARPARATRRDTPTLNFACTLRDMTTS